MGVKLDQKDCMILNILQLDGRTTYTELSKRIGLSVDSIKKRVDKMKRERVFYPTIHIRPRYLGFSTVTDVKVKLGTHKKEEIDTFIEYLMNNPRVGEIFSVSGEWDLSLVMVSKNPIDFSEVSSEIKTKFGNLIQSWSESTTLEAHKFEKYDMLKLLGHEGGLDEK